MKKFAIVTDSASDITRDYGKKLGVEILPLKTIFGEEEFLDGVTMNNEEFFEKLVETDVFPHTSQIAPAEYEEVFKKALEKYDSVLCITLSAKLSGCHQSANIAKEEFGDKVVLIDSNTVTIGERLLVERACILRDEGKDIEEAKEILESEKNKIRLVALLDTLEYLKKGGRLSATAAMVGTVLSIKPVIAVEDGEVKVLGKARGSKNGNNMLTQQIDTSGGIDFDMPYCVAYSGLSDALLKKYMKDHESLFKDHIAIDDIPVASIGSTIGTHAGPGAIAVAFYSLK